MLNRIIVLVYVFVPFFSFAQNISFDNDCIMKNSAKFTQSLLNISGDDFVNKLLLNNIRFVVVLEVDTLGQMLTFVHISKVDSNVMNKIENVVDYLKVSNIYFSKCYDLPMDTIKDSIILLAKKRLKKENNPLYINIGFPGELLSMYDIKENEYKKKGCSLSKLQYLKIQIEHYLYTQTIKWAVLD